MAELTELSQEIDRVVSAPYVPSLKVSRIEWIVRCQAPLRAAKQQHLSVRLAELSSANRGSSRYMTLSNTFPPRSFENGPISSRARSLYLQRLSERVWS